MGQATRIGYGHPRFDAAVELALGARAQHGIRARVGYLVRRPRQSASAALTIARLPRLKLRVSAEDLGQAILARTSWRTLGLPTGRLARSTLVLPDSLEAYLAGRRRQAVRTNLARARRQGIRCRTTVSVSERAERLAALLVEQGRGDDPLTELREANGLAPGRDEHFLAEDASGRTAAIGILVADVECAHLALFIASPSHPDAAAARYALSVHVIGWLIERGCRALIVDSALTLRPGLQYFQRRLGFQPYNLTVRVSEALRPRPATVEAPPGESVLAPPLRATQPNR